MNDWVCCSRKGRVGGVEQAKEHLLFAMWRKSVAVETEGKRDELGRL
jgi:hypothetical protein